MGPVKSGITNYLFFYLKGAKKTDLKFSSTPASSDGQLSDMSCRVSAGATFRVSDYFIYVSVATIYYCMPLYKGEWKANV